MTAWYLRRAVPWPVLAGGAAFAGLLMGAAHAWEAVAAVMVTLAVLVTASVAAFVLDEPARALTRVTPRGATWAALRRYAVGVGTVAGGLVLVRLAPSGFRTAEWSLVLAGLAVAGLAVAAWLSLRDRARPGGVVAPLLVMGGMAPLVLAAFSDVRVYPMPGLSAAQTAGWCGVLVLGVLVLARAVR